MSTPETIPFYKTVASGEEMRFIELAMNTAIWNKENQTVHHFFLDYFSGSSLFFTNSCASALELGVRALGIGIGDEVIIPAFGYVAVANAVVNCGARPVFADVLLCNANIDVISVKEKINERTKAIIVIDYAGNACDFNALRDLCDLHNIYLIEDAAQAVGSFHKGKPLGGFGDLGCLSFDYMKNITCGQGGLLVVNKIDLLEKVNLVFNEGTDRESFFKGGKAFYEWVYHGNNYKINPLATHFLAGQIEKLPDITRERVSSWNFYQELCKPLAEKGWFSIPDSSYSGNGHIFFILLHTSAEQHNLRAFLRENSIYAEFHYTSLPHSIFGQQFAGSVSFPVADIFSTRLLRLPIWNGISMNEIRRVVDVIWNYFGNK